MMIIRRYPARMVMIGFGVLLAAVLGFWSYTSLAADINNSLTAGPDPVRPNQTVVLTGRNFESNERVGIWVTYSNFKVYPVAEIRADGSGNFTLTYLPNFVGEPSGQYVYTAYGHTTGRQVLAYLQVETSQNVTPPSGGFTGLTVSPNAAERFDVVTITGYGYKDGEEVSVWVTYPNFSVEDIDTVTADGNGNFSLSFRPQQRGNGEYVFSANGNSSARTFYAEMQIGPVTTPDPGIPPAPPAEPAPPPPAEPTPLPTATPLPRNTNLVATPNAIIQIQDVTLAGTNFAANEDVSIWVTFPDTRVATVVQVRTDGNGNFSYTDKPDFLDDPTAPAGQYIYTARGQSSGQEVYATLQFQAAQTPPPLPPTGGDAGLPPLLLADPALARQNDTVTLEGRGFGASEPVSIWITYPDFQVFAVAQVTTNADGNFVFPFVLDTLNATFTPTGKYTYTARGQFTGIEVYADVQVEIAPAPATSAGIQVIAEPGQDSQGSFFTIRGVNFGTTEPLALWVRYPDNRVADLGQIETGPEGSFVYTMRVEGVPTGLYAFTAYGVRTGLTGIAEFSVTVSDLTIPSGPANLLMRPAGDDQRSFAIFEGSGFQPGESVSIWVTLPDNSTLSIGDVEVDAGGAFVVSLYLGEQEPIGRRVYTAYGNLSGRRATAEFTLFAGGPGSQFAELTAAEFDGR